MAAITGGLDFAHMHEWLPRAGELSSAGELDLSGVTRADSAGVAYLLELSRRAAAGGRTLTFTHPSVALSSLLEFLQVDEVLTIRR